MSIPGGLPPPRPDQAFSDPGAAMAPGAQAGVVRARQVIVYGPTGAVVGVFVYAAGTTPGPGNGPVDSITRAADDPFGNAVQPDFTAYGSGGAYAQLTEGVLQFLAAAGQFSPGIVGTFNVAGQCGLSSGEVSSGDNPANVLALSADANGGISQVSLQAQLVVITGNVTINGSPNTGTSGLANGQISGTSGAASAGTAHTHGPGSYAVTSGLHDHAL